MVEALKTFLIALQFFTRIPVTGRLAQWADYSPERLNRAAGFFPAVGLLVGALCATTLASAWWAFERAGMPGLALAALLSSVCGVMLTGAFHEDGLADTADALGGHVNTERALEIMKDSRLGTYGVLALVFATLAKLLLVLGVLSMSPALAFATLVVGHGVSRVAPLLVMAQLPYVGGRDGKSKPLAEQVSPSTLALAGATAVLAAGLCWGWVMGPAALKLGLAVLTSLVVTSTACVRWYRTRLGGFTGDGLGATQQLSELALWLVVLAYLLAN